GHGALLVLRADITAQMVWLSKNRLATVTVTSLSGEAPLREAARSLSGTLGRLLRHDNRQARLACRAWSAIRACFRLGPIGLGPPAETDRPSQQAASELLLC